MLVVAGSASATHPRPKGASPLYASLVPAYNACADTEPHARAAAGVPVV